MPSHWRSAVVAIIHKACRSADPFKVNCTIFAVCAMSTHTTSHDWLTCPTVTGNTDASSALAVCGGTP